MENIFRRYGFFHFAFDRTIKRSNFHFQLRRNKRNERRTNDEKKRNRKEQQPERTAPRQCNNNMLFECENFSSILIGRSRFSCWNTFLWYFLLGFLLFFSLFIDEWMRHLALLFLFFPSSHRRFCGWWRLAQPSVLSLSNISIDRVAINIHSFGMCQSDEMISRKCNSCYKNKINILFFRFHFTTKSRRHMNLKETAAATSFDLESQVWAMKIQFKSFYVVFQTEIKKHSVWWFCDELKLINRRWLGKTERKEK